jgi:hypothetical protein
MFLLTINKHLLFPRNQNSSLHRAHLTSLPVRVPCLKAPTTHSIPLRTQRCLQAHLFRIRECRDTSHRPHTMIVQPYS